MWSCCGGSVVVGGGVVKVVSLLLLLLWRWWGNQGFCHSFGSPTNVWRHVVVSRRWCCDEEKIQVMLFFIIIFINNYLENYIHGNVVFKLLLQRWMQRCSSIWCHGWSSYGVLGHLSSTPSRHHFMTSHIRGGAKTVAEALIPSPPSQQQQQQWHHLHNTTTNNNTTSTTTPHDVTHLWGNQKCAWTLDFPLLREHSKDRHHQINWLNPSTLQTESRCYPGKVAEALEF